MSKDSPASGQDKLPKVERRVLKAEVRACEHQSVTSDAEGVARSTRRSRNPERNGASESEQASNKSQRRPNNSPASGYKRRIARELAISILPQLVKHRSKLDKSELHHIISQAVNMLCEHAKECLAEADALRQKMYAQILDLEIEHPDNASRIQDLLPVKITTAELRQQLINLEQAANLVSEALDVPQLIDYAQATNKDAEDIRNFIFELADMYLSHRDEIDDFIRYAKSKWKIERMVSIDRDILRLACAEALFAQDVPIPVCISEAVELTHRFADERAAKYINGILGDLAEQASNFRRTGRFSFKDK